jgi:subtilisin family serine protease
MPGINGSGRLDYPNHPNIVCVSMTDSADNLRSHSGPHIDFAAPGWDIYTATTNSQYAIARGTSFAAPLFSGIAAMVMSINPALTAAQVIDVLRATAIDKGNPGWDEDFGWGRVNFSGAVNDALKTLPNIMSLSRDSSGIQVAVRSVVPMFLALERADRFSTSNWVQVAFVNSSSSNITVFSDQPESNPAFYRVRAEAVHE